MQEKMRWGDQMLFFTGWLVSSIIFGVVTRYVSRCRGYDDGFAWGFFLWIVGLLVVGFRPERCNSQPSAPVSTDSSSAQEAKNQKEVEEESFKPLNFGNEWESYREKKDNDSVVFIEPEEKKYERYNGPEKLDALKKKHDKGEISDMEYHIQKSKIMEEWKKHVLG